MAVRVGEWATNIDILLFSYVTKWNVVVVTDYLNGLNLTSNQQYLNNILHIERDISTKGTIHILFHKFAQPLDKAANGNHFSYLEPVSIPPFIFRVNSIIRNPVTNIQFNTSQPHNTSLTTTTSKHNKNRPQSLLGVF